MLDENKLKEYDERLVEYESRKLKGMLTNKELEEEKALNTEKELVSKFFAKNGG